MDTPSVAARWTYRVADEDPFPETLDFIDRCALLVGGDLDVLWTSGPLVLVCAACYLVVATCFFLFAR